MGITSKRDQQKTAIIDLQPTLMPDGRTVWAEAGLPISPSEIIVQPGGTIAFDDTVPLSTLPVDRMAAEGHWDRIISNIQAAEAGQTPPEVIVVQPGGSLVPVNRGSAGPELSKVPEDRMAAARACQTDLDEARGLDPNNVERWTFVDDPVIPGLRFEMRPVAQRFTFFTFRSPSHGGHWFLSPLEPNFDHLYGHQPHMLKLSIGGEKIPVVCRNPQTSAHRTLSEIRGTAAKFALYHDVGRSGQYPFSG